MNVRFIRAASLLFMTLTSLVSAAALSDPVQKGKDYYFVADPKRAISQFELAMRMNPDNPEPYLWLGRSYELLADLKPPVLAMRARLKARMYLTKAMTLAPECAECRRELFDLLLSSDDLPAALRQATVLVKNTPERDPELPPMQSLLVDAQTQRTSPEHLTMAILGFPWRTVAHLDQDLRSGVFFRPPPANDNSMR